MTREEAKKEIRDTFTEVWADGIIKALEQEPILDKIRAEIEREYLAEGHLSDYWIGLGKCLQIIDKYKADSEPQESGE